MDNKELINRLKAIAEGVDLETGEVIYTLKDKDQVAIYKALFLLTNGGMTELPNKKQAISSGLMLSIQDKELYQELKELRTKKALESGWKAYWFGSNRALEGIAYYRPKSINELGEVHGIGEKIIELCGNEYLSIVDNFSDCNDDLTVAPTASNPIDSDKEEFALVENFPKENETEGTSDLVQNPCQDCEKEIPIARLEVFPDTVRCVSCQSEFEKANPELSNRKVEEQGILTREGAKRMRAKQYGVNVSQKN